MPRLALRTAPAPGLLGLVWNPHLPPASASLLARRAVIARSISNAARHPTRCRRPQPSSPSLAPTRTLWNSLGLPHTAAYANLLSHPPSPLAAAQRRLLHDPKRPPPRDYDFDYDPETRTVQPTHSSRLRTAKPLLHWHGWRAVLRSPSTYTVAAVAVAAALVFYFANLETVPVSGRTRFNVYSPESGRQAGESEFRRLVWELENKGVRILPAWDPRTAYARRVLERLVPFSGLRDEKWEVFVVEDDRTANALVLPGGKVFVFSGILGLARNESGLATVLGHEIAHNLAGHHLERLSQDIGAGFVLYSMIILAGAFGLAPLLMHFFGSRVLDVAFGLPMSRLQESEADYIGLMMMAEACYDPTEATRFWARMEKASAGEPPEWMSTHPTNTNRIKKIQEWLPQALEKREQSDCRSTTAFADLFRQALRTGQIAIIR